jgi:hypothetical protein
MMKKRIFVLFAILATISLACSFSVQPPQAKTGPDIVTTIDEGYPMGGGQAELTLNLGAGELAIVEGSTKLVEGNVTTNIADWVPEVTREGSRIIIKQGSQDKSVNFPARDLKNKWELSLGTKEPLSLEINAGAYKNNIIFGKVPLANLQVNDGASQSKITFSEVNPQDMQNLVYKTGASQVDLINLANANFERMSFESGAGSYTLDFGGKLQRDADVSIKSGLSNLKIIVPKDTPCEISLTGGVNNVSLRGTWTINSNVYKTQISSGPKIMIDVDMGVGNLELIARDDSSL